MKNKDKREAKINLLLDNGIDLLWSKGYSGTSINDIVKVSQVPKGSFYFYFKNKNDFVLKCLDKYYASEVSPFLKVLRNKKKSPKFRLIAYYETKIISLRKELKCKNGCMISNLSNEVSDWNEEIRNKVTSFHNNMKKEIVDVIKEGQKTDELNTNIDAVKIAEFIEDAYNGSLISMKEKKNIYPVENVIFVIKKLLF